MGRSIVDIHRVFEFENKGTAKSISEEGWSQDMVQIYDQAIYWMSNV